MRTRFLAPNRLFKNSSTENRIVVGGGGGGASVRLPFSSWFSPVYMSKSVFGTIFQYFQFFFTETGIRFLQKDSEKMFRIYKCFLRNMLNKFFISPQKGSKIFWKAICSHLESTDLLLKTFKTIFIAWRNSFNDDITVFFLLLSHFLQGSYPPPPLPL